MGSLRQLSTGRTRLLEPELLVGRATVCSLRLTERHVSAQHALLRLSREQWWVRDLGSRNGTFLDGKKLTAGDEYALRRGSRLAFGMPEQQWELVDDSAPRAMIVPLDGSEPLLLEGDLVALPSADDPRATLYREAAGGWVLERADESVTEMSNLQTFDVGGRVWRLCYTEDDAICKTTMRGAAAIAPDAKMLELTFSVSSDEETVHLRARAGRITLDLGVRKHHYLLLTLARRRIQDVARGLPDPSCGWVDLDELAHDPTMAPPLLNLDVFRIREQFAAAGVVDAAAVIERRPRARQLRIGTGQLSVLRG
jgi:hypothetical protein